MKRKGISLIVLIITIVVIIILATAIIVNIAQTNLIENTNAAVFKSDISNMQDELTMYISDRYAETLVKYASGVDTWYTTTYNGTTYSTVGCWENSNGNRWLHSQAWTFAYSACDIQKLIYYIIGDL